MRGFAETVRSGRLFLTDGGIETRFMFGAFRGVELDPLLGAVPLLDDPNGRDALRSVYAGYLDAIRPSSAAAIIGTPTFRTSSRWVRDAGRDDAEVERLNRAAVDAHRELRTEAGDEDVYIAGVIGPAGDAYTPADALTTHDAERYHTRQASALAEAGVDFLFAPTFPAVEEAMGASNAMAATGLPYVISYVLGRDGRVLDGTTLEDAIAAIDSGTTRAPLHHSLSCIHPAVATEAVAGLGPVALRRLLECKCNGSALPTSELVQLDHVESDPPAEFAAEMWRLRADFGLQILGGCCGTDDRHIAALADLASA